MAMPNKTVAAARRAMGGFPAKAPKPHDDFMQWFFDQVQNHGRTSFESIESAQREYAAEQVARAAIAKAKGAA